MPGIRPLCTLHADLSMLQKSLKEKGTFHKRYCEVEYEVAVRFGGTQLQARLEWEEKVGVSIFICARSEFSQEFEGR